MPTPISQLKREAIAERESLNAAAPDLLRALELVRSIICDGALVGFNPMDGDWAERLYASQAVSAAAVRKAGGKVIAPPKTEAAA